MVNWEAVNRYYASILLTCAVKYQLRAIRISPTKPKLVTTIKFTNRKTNQINQQIFQTVAPNILAHLQWITAKDSLLFLSHNNRKPSTRIRNSSPAPITPLPWHTGAFHPPLKLNPYSVLTWGVRGFHFTYHLTRAHAPALIPKHHINHNDNY